MLVTTPTSFEWVLEYQSGCACRLCNYADKVCLEKAVGPTAKGEKAFNCYGLYRIRRSYYNGGQTVENQRRSGFRDLNRSLN